MRNKKNQQQQNFGGHFLAKFGFDLDEIEYVTTTRWFVEAYAKLIFAQVIIN